jgi:hypothetical protein
VDHALYDSVRGVQKQLESNQALGETTEATGITALNSDGYTGGALDQINGTTATNSFVDWLWKASGAPTTDNVAGAGAIPTAGSVKIDGINQTTTLPGSVAATRLSANTAAGFSVVTAQLSSPFTNTTIAHGLGKTPDMVIEFLRVGAGDNHWVWHKALASTEYLALQTTQAKATNSAIWNGRNSTTITVGSNTSWGAGSYVFYCFAEIEGFSKIGSYVGNNSADGPFVFTGFRPRFVLVKDTNSAGNWALFDSARSTVNGIFLTLTAQSSAAETSATEQCDFLANGFKLRATNAISIQNNLAGNTYIFYAVAESPFKYSNAR